MTTADDPVWALVRRDYENGVTQLTLSEKYNFDGKTIRRRIRLEGWSVITQHERDDAIIAQAAEEARSPQNRPTSPGDPQDERAAIILAHRREWKDIDRLRAEAQKAALEANYKPEDLTQDEAAQWSSHKRLAYAKVLTALYRNLVEGLTSKQEGERRAHGFDYKLQQEEKVDKEALEKQRLAALAFNEFMDDLQRKHGEIFH